MPESTLICPPSISYTKKFDSKCTEAIEKVNEKSNQSEINKILKPKGLSTLKSSIEKCCNSSSALNNHKRIRSRDSIYKKNEFNSNRCNYHINTEEVDDSETLRNNPRHKPTKPSYIHMSIERLENEGLDCSSRQESKEIEINQSLSYKSKLKKYATKINLNQNKEKLQKLKELDLLSRVESNEFLKPENNAIIVNHLSKKSKLENSIVLIERYVEINESQTVGYRLTSGSYGFLFKDNSKIIVSNDIFQFYCIDKVLGNSKQSFGAVLYNFSKFPSRLNSKMSSVFQMIELLNNTKFDPNMKRPANFETNFYLSKNIVYLRTI